MNPHVPQKIMPFTNPHSRFSNNEGRVNKQALEMEEVLDQIKEKSHVELAENRKPKMLHRKAETQAMAEATGYTNGSKNQGDFENFGSGKVGEQAEDEGILGAQVNEESESQKFLEEGMIESYIDFVYLTHGGMPVAIAPFDCPENKDCYNGRGCIPFTEKSILQLTGLLRKAETFLNEGEVAKSIEQYMQICKIYEGVSDFPIASYFYQKCLIISKQQKNPEGEAYSYMGLGLCEKGEKNILKAQEYYEIALEKALDKNLHSIDKVISEKLIEVYEKLAVDNESDGDYPKALEYYDKCLNASKRALNTNKEAECYLKLGMTYEKTKELEKSVESLEKYAGICKKMNNQDGYSLALKELAERNRQLGNTEASKRCLNELKEVQVTDKEKALESKAEASLKLGMIEFQNNNLQDSVTYFESEFFNMAKELKDQRLINIGRVNTAIAKGLGKLDLHKDIIKHNYQAFLSWKFKRELTTGKK